MKSMKISLAKRIGKLEGAMMQDNDSKPADLSMLSLKELDVLEKVLDYTLAPEAAAPTGKRPLVADPSGLSADDMVIYRKMAERAECRSPASINYAKKAPTPNFVVIRTFIIPSPADPRSQGHSSTRS
jgi:hypothetical protein